MQQDGQPFETSGPQKVAEPEQQGQTDSISELSEKLEAEQLKSEEYLDLLRRTQADFVNYRRRSNQEQNESRTTAQIVVLDQLLPVLDDVGRALESAPPELANHPWVQGIRLVSKRLNSTLEHLGVQQIGRSGEKFDPRWHEAIMTQKRPGTRDGTILQVTRPGYVFGDRIIRPAQVIVASSDQPM